MDLHLPVDLKNRTIDELTPLEKQRYEHQKIHEKHKGHEAMHLEMIIILLLTLIVAQILLVEWKKRYYKSYIIATILGLWLVPLGLSIKNYYWRFIIIWLIFSTVTALIMRRAMTKPIAGTTPRLVYKWFYFIYKLSYALGILGYIIAMCAFCGIHHLFNQQPQAWMDVAIVIIYYGIYYGVMGRDISEICSDRMAANVGYYTPKGMPTRNLDQNICAVCGNALLTKPNEPGVIEDSYKLPCHHEFHEFCIRGWCIIGKKQTCPYCKEKVDLKKLFCNPWERPHILYGQLLDWVRWLVAWLPLILLLVQGINLTLGLESILEGL